MAEPPTSPSDAPRLRSWILLASLVAGHAIYALLFTPFGPETFPRLMAMGVIFAHSNLLAAWMVLGPPPSKARLPLTFAAFVVITSCCAFGETGSLPPGFLLVEVGFFGIWAVLFLLLSKITRWTITNPHQAAVTNMPPMQFSLKYLLVLTTLCAILLGIGRVLVLRQGWTTSDSISRNIIMPIGFISLAIIPSIVVPLLVLSRRPSRRAMVILPLAWAALTWLAVETIVAIDANPGKSEIARAVIFCNSGLPQPD